MKHKKRFLLASLFYVFNVAFFLIFPLSTSSFAEFDSSALRLERANQKITDYETHIKVNQDKSYHITEDISADFKTSTHGIYRVIPAISNLVHNVNGKITKDLEVSKISNIKSSHQYVTMRKNSMWHIRIGDPDKTVEGPVKYHLSYDYRTFSDAKNYNDELYFNIIGDKWELPIGKAKFKIELPTAVNLSNNDTGFSVGPTGSTGYDPSKLFFHQVDNVITGHYLAPLMPGEGLTIIIKLPKNYFSYSHRQSLRIAISLSASILFVLIVHCIYRHYRKKDKMLIEEVSFYPPKKVSVADIAVICYGMVFYKHFSAILINLANHGYLKIIERSKEKKSSLRHSLFRYSIRSNTHGSVEVNNLKNGSYQYTFVKLKEYDGEDLVEKELFEGLFAGAVKQKSGETSVKSEELYDYFYKIVSDIYNKNLRGDSHKKYFKYKQNKLTARLVYLILAVQIFASILTLLVAYDASFIFGVVIYAAFYLYILLLFNKFKDRKKTSIVLKMAKLVYFLLFAIWAIPTLVKALIPGSSFDDFYFIKATAGIFSVMTSVYISRFLFKLPQRTELGQDLYGKILGFKRFLKVAKKDELEALVEENPNYFYDILPYTYIFGISKLWIEKFNDIVIPQASWYSGTSGGMLSAGSIATSIDRMSSSFNSGSSGSSSGGSGGSSSGGGSGGGGGGSW